MTFEQALEKLGEMAEGKCHALRFEKIFYPPAKLSAAIDCYIEGHGWTGTYNNYDDALADMERRTGRCLTPDSDSPGEDIEKEKEGA